MPVEVLYQSLLSNNANTVLTVTSKGSYKEDRVNIPNNDYLLSLAPLVAPTAKVVGVDLNEDVFTFTVVKGKEGYIAYQPYVASRYGVPCIVWGKVNKPLSEVPTLTLEIDNGKPVFCVEVGHEQVKFPIMLPKGSSTDVRTIKMAFKAGNLNDLLAKGFEKPSKLTELAPGTYDITAIRENVFKGEVSYEMFLKGLGWYKTNSKIRRKIEAGLEVSETEPAQLTCYGQVDQTAKGYPVIGIDLMSKEELDLPAFVF